MISVDAARDLQEAGLIWSPLPGDRFVVAQDALAQDVFYLADMTVEVHQFVGGSVIGFNGVAEWALDSVDLHETVWLPREDQMRAVLGEAFVGLARNHDQYTVVAVIEGQRRDFPHHDAEQAYAGALLAVLRQG